MVRAHDLAGDARVLYGPLSQRPTPAEAGSGALWVDPSDQTLYHVQSGNWVAVSPPSDGGGGGAPAGTPVLYGPYTVDYTDILHDNDTLTLWTPAVGDVLLRVFVDWQTLIEWDAGHLGIGVPMDWATSSNMLAQANYGQIAHPPGGEHLDNVLAAGVGDVTDHDGNAVNTTAFVCHTADPVQVQLQNPGGPDPTQGHVELYALVARAVAP